MLKFIRKISNWGVTENTPQDLVFHYQLTNVLFLFMFLASFGETFLLFASKAIQAALLNSTAPLVFGGGLLLMRSGHTRLARVLVMLVSCSAAYILLTSIGPGTYFQLIFLFSSAFGLVLFSSVRERPYLYFAMLLPVFVYLALELTSYQPVFGMERAHFSENTQILMRSISVLLVWCLMVLHMFFFLSGRKKMEEQLVLSAKMVALGRMAGGIAHEINNPLQLIVSNAEMLLHRADKGSVPSEDAKVSAGKIADTAMRIAAIVKGLVALSRDASEDNMSEVKVSDVLEVSLSCCRNQFSATGITLHVEPYNKNLLVRGRATQLSEVLLNILNNAFDALQSADERWVKISVIEANDHITFAITNCGVPIDRGIRPKIFDPFFTTKPPGAGTGLGLSISQAIVANHGGKIVLDESEPHTRFLIRLPRATSA